MTELALKPAEPVQTDLVESSRTSAVTSRFAKPVASLRAVPNIATWSGILLAVIGMVLLVVAWGKTAGITNVGRQIPFVLSAGFTGLGLIAVGLTLVNIAAKQSDANERTRQLGELRGMISELRHAVDGTDPEDQA